MQFNRKTARTLLLALVVLTSAVAGAAAWDTETTATTTTSDVSGASTSIAWYTDDSTQEVYFETDLASSGENYTLEISNGDAEISTVYYENDSANTPASGHRSWTVTHTELVDELPSGWSSGTYTVEVVNETGNAIESSELVLNKQGTNTTARVWVSSESENYTTVGDPLSADSLTIETDEPNFALAALGAENDTVATFEDDVSIDGNNTSSVAFVLNGQSAEAMDNASEGRDDGEWIYGAQLTADSNAEPGLTLLQVYKNEAPEDAGDNYAVYHEGNSTLVMPQNDEFNSANSIQVNGVAGESYGFWEAAGAFGYGETATKAAGL